MATPFEIDDGAAARAALGLIVLATDETMEPELRAILPADGVALYHARIPSAPNVTPETLALMEADMPRAAALLPDRPYAAIGYGCTSGATVIGPARVAALIAGARETAATTDPLTAAVAACRALGVRRLGFLTPYVAEVSAAMRAAFEAEGLKIAAFASFEEEREAVVARIAERSTLEAILDLGAAPEVDAVFASCTNLRAFGIVEEAERRLGKPVFSSNLALGWDMLRRAGLKPEARFASKLLDAG